MKNKKGITLIELVITIIVSLILAGVTIASLVGEGGILNKATKAKTQGEQSRIEEELKVAITALKMDYYEKQSGENFRDFLFVQEEKLKKELGDSNIKMDSEAKTITKDGIPFSVDENGNIAKIEGISLNDKKKRLNRIEGEAENPEAELIATLVTVQGDITWKSSDEETVKIIGSGNKVTIIGLKDGIAIVTANCKGEEASCEVTVRTVQIATELALNPTDIVIGKSETAEIVATQNGTEEVEWESSDNRIITVVGTGENREIGKITGIECGTAIITARVQNRTATCKVTVAITAESLLKGIEEIKTGGTKKIIVNGTTDSEITDTTQYTKEMYDLNVVMIDGELELSKELGANGKVKINGAERQISEITDLSVSSDGKTYSVGNSKDIGTANAYAPNTVVLKVNGNLIIQSEVTLTSITGTYGGPKGLIVYCEQALTNNGTISMSQRGAKAQGQNVFLSKNDLGLFSFISSSGGAGGSSAKVTNSAQKSGIAGACAIRICLWWWPEEVRHTLLWEGIVPQVQEQLEQVIVEDYGGRWCPFISHSYCTEMVTLGT